MNDKRKYLLINKYQVDYTKMLGKGAMAKVYLGYYSPSYEETDKNAKFAVKEISINSSFIATDSILQEINLLRKMAHPYILKYIDAKKSPTSLYLILEYCSEGTL
jgi:serine/threonine protein kinase